MDKFKKSLAFPVMGMAILAAGTASAQVNTNPATRTHVKMVGTTPFKFTSKLAKVVELNFTMGFHHADGKPVITQSLDRIAKAYAMGGKDAFTVQKFVGPSNGTAGGVPAFTVDDLLSGQVIVANNVSGFGNTTLGSVKQQAIQKAIETDGRGYLAFHASGDNEANGWAWFTNTLHPMNYQGHGSRTKGPVYKHVDEKDHMILEGILATKTTNVSVPTGVTGGTEQTATLPTRAMMNEWYRFGRDISTDPAFASKVTVLLKYDPRGLGNDALPPEFRRKGGNMFTYLYKVGSGITSYMPPGHANDELMDPNSGFDGGSGDYDRYIGQLLFYLAGYTSTACDASCKGLPLVDANNRIVGPYEPTSVRNYVANDLSFDAGKPAFSHPHDVPYAAVLTDVSGKVVATKRGQGAVYHEFDRSALKPGVYYQSVKLGKAAAKVKRYAIAATGA